MRFKMIWDNGEVKVTSVNSIGFKGYDNTLQGALTWLTNNSKGVNKSTTLDEYGHQVIIEVI